MRDKEKYNAYQREYQRLRRTETADYLKASREKFKNIGKTELILDLTDVIYDMDMPEAVKENLFDYLEKLRDSLDTRLLQLKNPLPSRKKDY